MYTGIKKYKNKHFSGPAPVSLEAKGSFAIYFKETLSIQLRRHSQLSLSTFPIFNSIPKVYISSTMSRSSSLISFLLPTCRYTHCPKAAQRGPKKKTKTVSDELHLDHILCSHDALPNDWPSPEHISSPLHHCKRGKTNLSTGTHRWEGIGTTGKNLLAINNQHSDIVLTLFL